MRELEGATMGASDTISHHFADAFFACRRRRRRGELTETLTSGRGGLYRAAGRVSPQVGLRWA